MNPNKTTPKRVLYGPYEGYELRCQRRLKTDLGVDGAAAEAVLHLRSQVVDLQTQIRQMQAELLAQTACQQQHFARYREVIYEASWVELGP